MGKTYTRETGRFSFRSEDGTEYPIYEITEFEEVSVFGGQTDVVEGLKYLQTSDGQHVEQIDKGRYRIVGVPEIDLVSDDPNAP